MPEIQDTTVLMETLQVESWKAKCCQDHALGDVYELTKWSKKDWDAKHSGVDFDLQKLKMELVKHCPDYGEPLTNNSTGFCINFCSKIMYEIGPASRRVKKSGGDKYWKCNITIPETNKKHSVHVATFKSENSTFENEFHDQYMVISIKQAGLLAMDTFLKIARVGDKEGQKYLTPLAGACFSKSDIENIANELKVPTVDVIVTINASAQSGGHYLQESDMAVAIACAFAATKNIKEEAVRSAIVNKVTRQYCNVKKEFIQTNWDTYSKYCTGGVPSHLSFETLKSSYEKNQQLTVAQIRTARKELDATKTTFDSYSTLPEKSTESAPVVEPTKEKDLRIRSYEEIMKDNANLTEDNQIRMAMEKSKFDAIQNIAKSRTKIMREMDAFKFDENDSSCMDYIKQRLDEVEDLIMTENDEVMVETGLNFLNPFYMTLSLEDFKDRRVFSYIPKGMRDQILEELAKDI